MRPRVPLEVEGVVEALAAEGAEVTLHVAMTLHVTIEQSLQIEILAAHAATEAVVLWIKAPEDAHVRITSPRNVHSRHYQKKK